MSKFDHLPALPLFLILRIQPPQIESIDVTETLVASSSSFAHPHHLAFLHYKRTEIVRLLDKLREAI